MSWRSKTSLGDSQLRAPFKTTGIVLAKVFEKLMRPEEATVIRELSATNADAAQLILHAARLLGEAAGDIAGDKALTEADRHNTQSRFMDLTVALLARLSVAGTSL